MLGLLSPRRRPAQRNQRHATSACARCALRLWVPVPLRFSRGIAFREVQRELLQKLPPRPTSPTRRRVPPPAPAAAPRPWRHVDGHRMFSLSTGLTLGHHAGVQGCPLGDARLGLRLLRSRQARRHLRSATFCCRHLGCRLRVCARHVRLGRLPACMLTTR